MAELNLDYYKLAWARRAEIMTGIMASETSLSRVLARFDEFEARHKMWEHDGQISYEELPRSDPITRLEEPVKAISCGAPILAFPFSTTNFGSLISSFAQDCDTVVELGSGYGRRLFETWLAGGPGEARYIGIEPAASGRDLAIRLAALEPAMKFISVPGDHSNFDPANLGGRRTLFVTCFSLMYVPAVTMDLFRRIAGIPGEVLCLFIEPFGFQLFSADERAKMQLGMCSIDKTNFNFYPMLQQASAEGLFETLFVGRDLFSLNGDFKSLGSIIVAAKS